MRDRPCYFVEDYDPRVDCSDGTVVALTPEACYGLGRAGIAYTIVEDFYSAATVRGDEDRYFYEQLEWFKEFDAVLKKNVSFCREHEINLPKANFLSLKIFIDSTIMQARIMNAVIQKIRPTRVVYVRVQQSEKDDADIYNICNNKRRFFAELSERACAACSIPFFMHTTPLRQQDSTAPHTVTKAVKQFLKALHLKSVYYFFKYQKWSAWGRKNIRGNALTIVVIHAGWLGIDIIIRKAIAAGCTVFFRDGDKAVRVSTFFQKVALDIGRLKNIQRDKIAHECASAFNRIVEEKKIVAWVSERSGVDVSELITPYLKYFVEDFCVNTIAETIALQTFYKKERIDFVIARSSSETDSISTFLAATPQKKRVCFQHGVMYEEKVAAVTELDLADHYFAMDDVSERFFKRCRHLDYVSDCDVAQSSHYLYKVKQRWANARRPSNVIMYVPTRIAPSLVLFNFPFYMLTEYFELQKAIIDYMGSATDKNFIYKGTATQEWFDNSLFRYIKEKRYQNIHIERRPLIECLGMAEKLFLDYPGTGLYEAAACAIPAMSVCRKNFLIGDTAEHFFGKAIQYFSTIPEAVQKIDRFIHAAPDDFLVTLPCADIDIVATLGGLNAAHRKQGQ